MRHILLAAGLAALLAAARPALAQFIPFNQSVVSGAEMVWDAVEGMTFIPPYPNQIYVGQGQIWIEGVGFVTNGVQINTVVNGPLGVGSPNWAFDSTVAGGVQAASKVYYVYAANCWEASDGGLMPAVLGNLQWVISLVQPNPGGDPSQPLKWTPPKFPNEFVPPGDAGVAVFVGSYITDSSAKMVPFMKEGDEVILTPYGQSLNTYQEPDTSYVSTVDFSASATYPNVQELDFGSAPIPLSASELIVDLIMTNTDSLWHQTNILNPTLETDFTAGFCGSYPQYVMVADPQLTAGIPTTALYNHVRIKTAINQQIPAGAPGTPAHALNTIQVAGCSAPSTGQTYGVQAAYVGYTEVTHHLSL